MPLLHELNMHDSLLQQIVLKCDEGSPTIRLCMDYIEHYEPTTSFAMKDLLFEQVFSYTISGWLWVKGQDYIMSGESTHDPKELAELYSRVSEPELFYTHVIELGLTGGTIRIVGEPPKLLDR